MSTFEQKTEVVREFLLRQAKLGRLTNFFEVQTAAGLALAEKGYREGRSSWPVSRSKVADVLHGITDQDVEAEAPLLASLVVHFGDQLPGHRFDQYAAAAGLIPADEAVDREKVLEVHAAQVQAVFAKYGSAQVVDV